VAIVRIVLLLKQLALIIQQQLLIPAISVQHIITQMEVIAYHVSMVVMIAQAQQIVN
jgi:hypothetical protein